MSPSLPPKARTIQTMFSTIAPRYDLLNHLLSFGIDFLWRRQTVRIALKAIFEASPKTVGQAARLSMDDKQVTQYTTQNSKPLNILDVCCGTGDLTLAFAKSLPPSSIITGLDFSHAMLQIALDKSRSNSNTHHPTTINCTENISSGNAEPQLGASIQPLHPSFTQADALNLPFPDNTFDIASVAFGLRNFTDRPAGIREMARIVRKDGLIVILEFSKPNPWLRPFYHLYLHILLPTVGRLFSRTSAYRYLADTVSAFATPDEVSAWMRQAGLSQVTYKKLTQGIVVLHTGKVL